MMTTAIIITTFSTILKLYPLSNYIYAAIVPMCWYYNA